MNLKITTILGATALTALGACTDPAATGLGNMNKAQQGALAGAAIGAVLGEPATATRTVRARTP